MLPAFEVVARHRPVAIVGTPVAPPAADGAGEVPLPLLAPFGAVEAALSGSGSAGAARLELAGADGTRLTADLEAGRATLGVTVDGDERTFRSRRHGRVRGTPDRVALTLTGSHLAVLVQESGTWLVRGRVDLRDAGGPDVRDPGWLGALTARWSGDVAQAQAGGFGQLGLRDIRVVTHADGSPYREDGTVLLSATSAGPGFFDTAHTSVWALAPDHTVQHRADLFFRRSDRPGAWGDHATHVVRDGDRWLVATSTWSGFPDAPAERATARVGVTLATTTADVTRGQHLLTTRPLDLPTDGPSVGVWDPHLVRDDDGSWLVGYVSARRFFDFHPVLAAGSSLAELTLRGAATDRRATEGTTLLRTADGWRVLASDGRGNHRAVRGRYPVFDGALRDVGTLRAPYPTNIPWPTVVPPHPDEPGEGWRLVTFDGTPTGGRLAGYGTHGDLLVMAATD